MKRARQRGRLAVLGALLLLAVMPARPAWAQGTLSALQTDVDKIAGRARPSVVAVFAQRQVVHRNPLPGQPAKRLHTRVGSGVAVGESEILTTASVVIGAERVLVRTVNGLQVTAQVAGMDPIFNLALLRVPDVRLPTVAFATQTAQVGDWVIALGTSYRAQPTQSVGNVAVWHREPRTSLIQLTNTVYPGNSGGAALNARGQLVGIVQGELGTPDFGAGGTERRPSGMSFVVPFETVRPVYESLRREGRVRHGWLGVSTLAASVESDAERGARVALGAMVESVVPGGPAQRMGLRHGDLIVAFDRERVEYPEQLARWVTATRPGSTVELVWVRELTEHSGRVTLGESPTALPEWVVAARGGAGEDPERARSILDIERRIQELNRELEKLKGSK